MNAVCPSLPQKPGMDVADGYVTFVRHSQDILRDKVNEEVYIERLFDVSKMPSPPHHKGGSFHNVVKTTGQEGISFHFITPPKKRGDAPRPSGRELIVVLHRLWRLLSLFASLSLL